MDRLETTTVHKLMDAHEIESGLITGLMAAAPDLARDLLSSRQAHAELLAQHLAALEELEDLRERGEE